MQTIKNSLDGFFGDGDAGSFGIGVLGIIEGDSSAVLVQDGHLAGRGIGY